MQGGADTFNLLVPHSECYGPDLYAEYAAARGRAALSKASLLTIDVPTGTQPCSKFGVHSSMPYLKSLYDGGDAIFEANVGVLVGPITQAEYTEQTKPRPRALFAHNIQQMATQSLQPNNPTAGGVLGRILTALDARGPSPAQLQGEGEEQRRYRTAGYSLAGVSKALDGWERDGVGKGPEILDVNNGVIRMQKYDEVADDVARLNKNVSSSIYATTAGEWTSGLLSSSEALSLVLDNVSVTQTFPSGENSLGQALKQVARVIKAREALGAERDVFLVEQRKFDSHSDLLATTNELYGFIDESLAAFVEELKGQGVWDSVVVQAASEFGRTLSSNGMGTDHGWGGNAWTVGGAVAGGRVVGTFPPTMNLDSELPVGRGRLIPTTAWEGIWRPLCRWFGVEEEELPTVLPNLASFPESYLLSEEDMFG